MTQETTYIDPFSDTRYANLTPQQKREYDRELKERWDRAAEAESHYLDGKAEGHAKGLAEGLAEGHAKGRAEGHAKGLAEGHAKGRAEEAREIAKKLKKMGSPMDFITHATGLSAEEVEKL